MVIGIALLMVLFVLALYALIDAETSSPTVVDRETAEREAQRRGGLRDRKRGSARSNDDSRESEHRNEDLEYGHWDDDEDGLEYGSIADESERDGR
ncbi:hypothetical protein [Halopiger goleimassiliensis]|uniref:hypothetical protein n=1 Tax=Halopiger goleimassiliensis TaxID=1293048 RepID=UPI000677809B|nr:hypothetical protein [Halopiger goleimassiliensis]